MDFANRGNRAAQEQNSQPVQNNTQPTAAFQPPKGAKKRGGGSMDVSKLGGMLMLGLGTILIAAVIIGLVFGGSAAKESDLIDTSKYQAVFLDSPDGQVYFGKLDVYNSDLYRLTDIFYVRVEQALQPEGANQAANPNISLAKLGNELHGPEDAMFISRDKVLYWENLKTDGQVTTAIQEFIDNGRQTNDAQTGTQQNPVANPQGQTEQQTGVNEDTADPADPATP